MLRKIFGPKKEELTRKRGKLQTKELKDLYSSPNVFVVKSRIMRWTEHVVRMGEWKGVCRVLVGKPEGNRTLGRPTPRRKDNIKMDLHKMGCGGMAWMELAQDKDSWRTLENAVMYLRVL